MTDELVERFMRAVRDLGQGSMKGRADGKQIMECMGLEPSSIGDNRKPTTDDDHLYTDIARRCDEIGYIKKVADRYEQVAITERGRQYVAGL